MASTEAAVHETRLAGRGRRLAGGVIDFVLAAGIPAAIVVFVFVSALQPDPSADPDFGDEGAGVVGAAFFALIFPPLYWLLVGPLFLIVARNGQTPGKLLLRMCVIDSDGEVTGWGYTLLREVVVKVGLFGSITAFSLFFVAALTGTPAGGLVGVLAPLWCVWDKDRQCLWDKVVETRVVYARGGRLALDQPRSGTDAEHQGPEHGLGGPGREMQLASPSRRLAGAVIDFAVAVGMPLAIGGWLIVENYDPHDTSVLLPLLFMAFLVPFCLVLVSPWFLLAARNGQTPGKLLLDMYAVGPHGRVAGWGYTLYREVVVKVCLFGAVTVLTAGLGGIAAALWCLRDGERRCLWDRVARTRVIHAPRGRQAGGSPAPGAEAASRAADNIRSLAELRERGLLTHEEFEERRAREVERL